MIKSENFSSLNLVTFVHTFRVPGRDVRHMMPRLFATVFEHGLVNWHIQISESGGIPFFIRNAVEGHENRPPVCQIMLHPAGQRERHPPVARVDFKIRTLLGGKDHLSPLSFTHPPGFPPRTLLNSCYCTPEQGPISSTIAAILELRDSYEFEVQTTIVFNIEDFLDIRYINRSIGRPMPVELSFRYNLLMNCSTHNFALRTATSQDFPCNKEALFVASPFFRKALTPQMTFYPMGVEHLEAIEVTITWMLTETYHPPVKMTPELADEVLKLTDRVVPRGPNQRQLLGSIERHCYEELVKNFEDLLYVKHMLLVAHNNRLGGLLEACHGTIIAHHFMDFQRDLEQNPNPQWTATTQLTRSSAFTRFNENYIRSRDVCSFVNKTPMKISP